MRTIGLVALAWGTLHCACGTLGPAGGGQPRAWPVPDGPAPAAPELVAPGLLSTGLDERDFALSPDGGRALFTVWSGGAGTIVEVRRDDPRPRVVRFSGRHSDLEPTFAADGSLLFASNRPLPGTERKDFNIWTVARQAEGWGEPQPLRGAVNTEADEFYPSVTRDGTLYFTAVYTSGLGKDDLYRAPRAADGSYPRVERLPKPVNSEQWEFNALIDPDERFLVFSVAGRLDGPGRGDLAVSFRSPDGWSAPHLIDVNSEALDYCPALSPDGKTLFFSSRRSNARAPGARVSYDELQGSLRGPGGGGGDLYRVSIDAIERLRSP